MNKEIYNKVIATVSKQFDIDKSKIKPTTNFNKDLDADSIDDIELLMALENKFNAKIPDSDAHKLQTVKEVTDYIQKHQN